MKQTRRHFLKQTSGALLASGMINPLIANESQVPGLDRISKGKAEHVIYLWLGGGACQADTWDPKALGNPKERKAGSAYPSIKTSIEGIEVCEHLRMCADRMEKFAPVRTCYHNIIDEHSAANNFVHTGRKTTGTLTYPSIGSLVAHQKGALDNKIPPYVVIGYPSIMRGPGFLGPKHSFIYLTDTEKGPLALANPSFISKTRSDRRKDLLNRLNSIYSKGIDNEKSINDYMESQQNALELSGGDFMKAFQLDKEKQTTRDAFGDEFGQRCLLARRLIQRGVRFTEVSFNLNFINGTGWDTHKGGQLNQHHLISSLDNALAALVDDLESHNLLEKTLVVVATEFGRPIGFDGAGGRGHWSKSFSMVFAGGGLKTGQVIGKTDEKSQVAIERPVSIPDFHATIHHALGIDYSESIYSGDRPVPITDNGLPILELFS